MKVNSGTSTQPAKGRGEDQTTEGSSLITRHHVNAHTEKKKKKIVGHSAIVLLGNPLTWFLRLKWVCINWLQHHKLGQLVFMLEDGGDCGVVR